MCEGMKSDVTIQTEAKRRKCEALVQSKLTQVLQAFKYLCMHAYVLLSIFFLGLIETERSCTSEIGGIGTVGQWIT